MTIEMKKTVQKNIPGRRNIMGHGSERDMCPAKTGKR